MSVRTFAETPIPVNSTSRLLHRGIDGAPRNLPRHRRDGGLPQGLDDGPGDGEAQSATHQSVSNQSAALRLAALDGPDRPAEEPRRLLVRAAFQVAEHDRRTIFLRQPVHLLVDRGIKIEVARASRLRRSGPHSSPRDRCSCLRRRMMVDRRQDAVRQAT